jgi:hypothetical protein
VPEADDSVLEASAPNGSATDAPASDVLVPDAPATATEAAEPMKLATAAVPPPPPRRLSPGAPRGREIVGASATISVTDGDGAAPVSVSAPEREPTSRRRRVRWYWRVLAWIAAVPIGFVLTVWPAYEFGLIRKDDVLDVFVGSGAGRYTRLAIVTVLWALVTALLVQLFVEGGRWWAARRRERADNPPGRRASAAAS